MYRYPIARLSLETYSRNPVCGLIWLCSYAKQITQLYRLYILNSIKEQGQSRLILKELASPRILCFHHRIILRHTFLCKVACSNFLVVANILILAPIKSQMFGPRYDIVILLVTRSSSQVLGCWGNSTTNVVSLDRPWPLPSATKLMCLIQDSLIFKRPEPYGTKCYHMTGPKSTNRPKLMCWIDFYIPYPD